MKVHLYAYGMASNFGVSYCGKRMSNFTTQWASAPNQITCKSCLATQRERKD